MKQQTVIKNTYPQHPGIPYAAPGSKVRWVFINGFNFLLNEAGEKVFRSALLNGHSLKIAGNTPPPMTGIIRYESTHNWILEIGD